LLNLLIVAAALALDCNDASNQNNVACIGTKPTYCGKLEYSNALACFNSNPSYCSRDVNENTLACASTKPEYCKKGEYANVGACVDLLRFCSLGRIALPDCLAYALKKKQ